MSHNVQDAIEALDGADSVRYDRYNDAFIVEKDGQMRSYTTDFQFIGLYFDRPIGPELPPGQMYSHPIGPELPPGQFYAAPIGPKLQRKRKNPEHHHGGLRCRSIRLPTDEQHACAHCHAVMPLGGRAYGIGSGAHVVPVCSMGCATDYARASAGGSHHGG